MGGIFRMRSLAPRLPYLRFSLTIAIWKKPHRAIKRRINAKLGFRFFEGKSKMAAGFFFADAFSGCLRAPYSCASGAHLKAIGLPSPFWFRLCRLRF